MTNISVIITTHNSEKYIEKCLNELCNQTYSSFEVIIVDDCSSDMTIEICKTFRNKFRNGFEIIELFENKKLPGKVRNVAINSKKIYGKYVVFLDGDDSIEESYLELMYKSIIENNADMVICAYDRVDDESGNIICKEMTQYKGFVDLDKLIDNLAYLNGSAWNRMYKLEKIKEINFPEIKCGEDLIFQFLAYMKCDRIAFINDILIHYHVRTKSIISSIRIDEAICFAECFLENYKKAPHKFKNVMELAIFIHIGISMPMKIVKISKKDTKKYLRWVSSWFTYNFKWFATNKLMKINCLNKFGIRGMAIYMCLFMYKTKTFYLFILMYEFVVKLIKKDIKF